MKGKLLQKLMLGLYGAVVVILVLSVYTVTFQTDSTQSRCHGDDLSCPLQQDRQNFQRLFESGGGSKMAPSSRELLKRPWPPRKSGLLSSNLAQQKDIPPYLYDAVEVLDPDLGGDDDDKDTGVIPPADQFPVGNEDEGFVKDDDSPPGTKDEPKPVANLKAEKSPGLKEGRPVSVREFPPLYHPVLPNGLDCSRVWEGEEEEKRRAVRDMNDTSAARRPPGFYNTIIDNCPLYRQHNGFIQNVSQEEREFPLAFSVMVYKDPEQLERLLRAVYRPHNVYCVHPDLKTKPQVLQQIRAIIKCLPNVFESPRQIDVQWGKFSVLEPELICMQELWRMRTKWKYFINLTGQEFPLKTNKELVKILTAYHGANDILGESPKERNMWRWKKAKVPAPHNITVAKGPVHVAASRGFVDFLLHSKYARDFLEWTKETAIPDETFFATLNNMNKFRVPGSYTGNITSRRHIMLNRFKIWDTSKRTCNGKFVRHICHFGLADVAGLIHSRHFIANKFTYDFYPLAFDCLEQWYFHRVEREEKTGFVDIDTRYYSNLEIVKYAYRGETGSER